MTDGLSRNRLGGMPRFTVAQIVNLLYRRFSICESFPVASRLSLLLAAALFPIVDAGCVSRSEPPVKSQPPPAPAVRALQELKSKYASGNRFGLYAVGLEPAGPQLMLTGMVDKVAARMETEQAMDSL